MKRAFCFYYADLYLGGIQTYLLEMIRYFIENSVDVYWITKKGPQYDSQIEELIDKIHIISQNNNFEAELKHLDEKYDSVVILTFSYLAKDRLSRVIEKNALSIKTLLLIAHVTGRNYYPEMNFSIKWMQDFVKKKIANVYRYYNADGALYFFCIDQQRAFIDRYGFFDSCKLKVAPKVRYIPFFDEREVEERYDNDVFNIVSISRFEFPHKGYLLGLIDVFPIIKNNIPNAKLIIIGDGNDKYILQQHIDALPNEYLEAIELKGQVSYFDLGNILKTAKVGIGVAGVVYDFSKYSIPTLIARHYTDKCEVYGFYSNELENSICMKEGDEVMPYLVDVYSMNKEEYFSLSLKTHMAVTKEFEDSNPNWVFEKTINNRKAGNVLLYFLIKFRSFVNDCSYKIELLYRSPKTFIAKLKNTMKV